MSFSLSSSVILVLCFAFNYDVGLMIWEKQAAGAPLDWRLGRLLSCLGSA